MKEIYDGYKFKDELLDCPFCGENKEAPPTMCQKKKKHFNNYHYTVYCLNCGCEPDWCVESEEEAITYWNSRVSTTQYGSYLQGFNECKKKMFELLKI